MDHPAARTLGRRELLQGTALLAIAATTRTHAQAPAAEPQTTLADAPLGPAVTITAERRGDIVLVGLNRPFIQNRLDPPTRMRLRGNLYYYQHQPSPRALVLFRHRGDLSRRLDVDAPPAGK